MRRSAAISARASGARRTDDARPLSADQESAGQLLGQEARLLLTAVKAGIGRRADPGLSSFDGEIPWRRR
jgi:hypothetical protein